MLIGFGSKWLKSTRRFLGTKLPVYAQALLELLIDSHWVHVTLELILQEPDDSRRNELIDTWLRHRFADLDRINITASAPRAYPGCSCSLLRADETNRVF